METIVLILSALAALLFGGGAVYLRGRSAGRRSVPTREATRAEAIDELVQERAQARQPARDRAIAQIREEAALRAQRGVVGDQDAEQLEDELARFREER